MTSAAWTCEKFPRTAEHAQQQKTYISAHIATEKHLIFHAQVEDHRFGRFRLRPGHCLLLDIQRGTATVNAH